jgi:hypothetical protein
LVPETIRPRRTVPSYAITWFGLPSRITLLWQRGVPEQFELPWIVFV